MDGLIHVYTGEGKGKTTAAFGLAMRYYGRGGKVLIAQFLKCTPSGEALLAEKLGIDLIMCTSQSKFVWDMTEDELLELKNSTLHTFYECIKKAFEYDLIIFDELICALDLELIDKNEVINFLKSKPSKTEVVLTGRGATKDITEIADYVSEIVCIKHPFEKGIAARKGVEF